MANTRVGLTTGKEFWVDGSAAGVRSTIDRAGGRWVTLTVGDERIELVSGTVAYLIEQQPA
jgi:hypothetical protein